MSRREGSNTNPTGSAESRRLLDFYQRSHGGALSFEARRALCAIAEHAPALSPLVFKDPSVLNEALSAPLEQDCSSLFSERVREAVGSSTRPELYRALRRIRHRLLVRIALREVLHLADVDTTSAELAALASALVDVALRASLTEQTGRHGAPRRPSGAPIPLVAIGMGKLGGRELNPGSDIDLCFFYETDEGEVPSGLSINEFFAQVVRAAVESLYAVTEDGFCFRVDLRLRPEGSRGVLVNSLASAERYYETWGRTWERAALLRAAPVGGDLTFGTDLLDALRPFVFRRAVDPALAAELGSMLERSRKELCRDGRRDLKLGPGGIREAEFFVQALQLIWGGQHPELQVPGTLEALRRLRKLGLVGDSEAIELEQSWTVLRRLEHRVQLWSGYQTHLLPLEPDEKDRFARAAGFEDAAALDKQVDQARGAVRNLFLGLQIERGVEHPELHALCDLVSQEPDPAQLSKRVAAALRSVDADEVAAHLLRLAKRADAPLGPVGRERFRDLGVRMITEAMQTSDPAAALGHLADLFQKLAGTSGYSRLLSDDPRMLRRIVSLFGTSETLSRALVARLENLDSVMASAPSTITEIASAHEAASENDVQALVSSLRRIRNETTLRVGIAYVAQDIRSEQAQELLTSLAEHQIGKAFAHAWREALERGAVPERGPEDAHPASMVVVGLGKLGGSELGFGGDLDLMFIYGAEGPEGPAGTNRETFTRIAQRTMRLLSQPDVEGPGYSIDARLRPSGSQGLLVTSLSALESYHERLGQDWERQALTRARVVAGDPALYGRVTSLLMELAYMRPPEHPEHLARLRRRMEKELAAEAPGRYHCKVGYGALVDVEFTVQWLQRQHGADPSVRGGSTLAALSALTRAGHVSSTDGETLTSGYRFFRDVEQHLRLLDEHDPIVIAGTRRAERIARALRVRPYGHESASSALLRRWRCYAKEIRGIFERVVAPVGTTPAWEAK